MFRQLLEFFSLISRRPPSDPEALAFRERLERLDTDGARTTSFLSHFARHECVLGSGEQCFLGARDAIRRGVPFAMDDVRANWPPGGLQPGAVIVVSLSLLGLWIWTASRVRDVVDETDAQGRRFGFVYETLPSHVERGEEWFLVEWDIRTDEVCYRVQSIASPRFWFMIPGVPLARTLQRRFKRRSAQAMLEAADRAGTAA